MSKFRSKASATVEAVQWKGDNLTEIQTFMYPSSPLYNADQLRDSPGSTMKPNLGLHVFTGQKYTQFELQHPGVGSWIVKGPVGFKILTAEEFETLYEAVVYEPDTGQEVSPADVRRPNDPFD